MSHEKISDFVSFSLFRFTLVINLIDFDFESHLNTLIVLEIKNDVRFDYVQLRSLWSDQNLARFFFCLSCIFWHYYRNSFQLKSL